MFKTCWLYIYEYHEPVLLQCILLQIYRSCLFQFSPRLFGSTNVHSTLRSLSREAFSRRGSTVGPGSITMKPKISSYAYRRQNLDEACILNVCSTCNWKTKCISFRKHNSLKDHQGSVLKVLSKTCGDIGEIMSKKHAVEKKEKKLWLSENNFVQHSISLLTRNIFCSKRLWPKGLKSGPNCIKPH